jgi:hypothetical protein
LWFLWGLISVNSERICRVLDHPGFYSWASWRMVNRSPRIRTCLRAKALQRAGVNFPCTTAAFTLPPEPAGFVMLCQLAQELSLVCGFCSSARTFAIGLLSDLSLRRRPCLRLVLLVVFMNMNTLGSRTGDFHPISPRPCRVYSRRSTGSAGKGARLPMNSVLGQDGGR